MLVAGLVGGCDNSGNGDSTTTNDVKKGPSGGASASVPAGNQRTPTRIVSPSTGPG